MNHKEECFISRLDKGMRIWDKKNPEPNENLDESAWIEWYKKRAAMCGRGIKKLADEMGIEYSENLHWVVPCTCTDKKSGA